MCRCKDRELFISNRYRPFRAHAILFPQFTWGKGPSLVKAATIVVTPSTFRTETTLASDLLFQTREQIRESAPIEDTEPFINPRPSKEDTALPKVRNMEHY